jgi:hypothetical protein
MSRRDMHRRLASIPHSAFMRPHIPETPMYDNRPDAKDEGERHLRALIDALEATRLDIGLQLQRLEQATSLAERGDVLRDAIVAVEDRLSPQERLAQLARLGDAYDLITGTSRR